MPARPAARLVSSVPPHRFPLPERYGLLKGVCSAVRRPAGREGRARADHRERPWCSSQEAHVYDSKHLFCNKAGYAQ